MAWRTAPRAVVAPVEVPAITRRPPVQALASAALEITVEPRPAVEPLPAAAVVVALAPSEDLRPTALALPAARAPRSRLQEPHQAGRMLLGRTRAAAAAEVEATRPTALEVQAAAVLLAIQEPQELQTLAAVAAAMLPVAVPGSS